MELSLTAGQIALVIGVILPTLTALITKSTADPRVKQVVNLALAAVGGFFATVVADTPFDVKHVLISIGYTFVFSVASYFGLKSIVVTPIEDKTGTKGIG